MRIVYHMGVHCTDEDRLIRCLLKNRAMLADQGIAVPSPTRYRNLLRDAAKELRGARASTETAELILDQIMDNPQAERVVLSWSSFLSFPAYAVSDGLYARGGERMHGFRQMLPDHEAEFFLAVRNPASFLPDLRGRIIGKGFDDVLRDVDPAGFHWSDTVEAIKAANPGVPVTVWCDEDTPLIWTEVLHAVAALDPAIPFQDDDELLALLMTEAGLARYQAYCREHPPQSVAQRRRIVTAFLEKFGRPERLAAEIDVPDWSETLIEELTTAYLADITRIQQIPGVQLIEP